MIFRRRLAELPRAIAAADKFHAPVEQPNGGSDIMAVIARAASDPNTDVEKLEKLLGMYERITAKSAKAAYMAALAEMQPELPVVKERGGISIGKGSTPQPYALWEDINEAIRPVLHKHGFALSFRTGRNGDRVTVTGVLSHREGHCEETTMELPSDNSGSKNAVQAVGSSTSYGKRYTAIALLNITSSGEDDNGKAGGGGLIDEGQRDHIRNLIERTKADVEKFCAHFKIDAIPDLPVAKYEDAIRMLNLKAKAIQQ